RRLRKARTVYEDETAEAKIITQVSEGWYDGKGKKRTLESFIREVYLPWAEVNKRSVRIDKSRAKPIIAFFSGKALKEITVFSIEKFKAERKSAPVIRLRKDGEIAYSKPRSPGAVNRELCLLSKILSLAVDKKELKENPARKVKLLDGERERTRYLLPEEEDRLASVLTGSLSYLREIVDLYINTGARANELLRLRVPDVDLHRDIVRIDGSKPDEYRQVPLNDTSRRIFQELVTQANSKGWIYLFTNPETGRPFQYIRTGWLKACKLAGIGSLRIHDLRHTFGTRAADAGVPLPAIRDVMGHKSTKTTERYTHATDAGKRRAVEAAERKPGKLVKIWSKVAGGRK